MSKEDLEEEGQFPEIHEISFQGEQVVSNAIVLLKKILDAHFLRPAQSASAGKLLHVLSRLPKPGTNRFVSLTLNGPTKSFFRIGEEHKVFHWWEVCSEGTTITVTTGGHFWRSSTGGDAFTSMLWSSTPGSADEYSDFLQEISIVDDALPFDREVANIDLTEQGYSIEIIDEENGLFETPAEDLNAD